MWFGSKEQRKPALQRECLIALCRSAQQGAQVGQRYLLSVGGAGVTGTVFVSMVRQNTPVIPFEQNLLTLRTAALGKNPFLKLYFP